MTDSLITRNSLDGLVSNLEQTFDTFFTFVQAVLEQEARLPEEGVLQLFLWHVGSTRQVSGDERARMRVI